MLIPILQTGANWIVVDKPAGLPTQAPAEYPSLERLLREQREQQQDLQTPYLALPHRLDVPVSGVILIALTKKSARLISQQFEARKVQKTYHAIVKGDARNIEKHWEDQIEKLPDQARVRISTDDSEPAGGKARLAQTVVQRADFDPVTEQTHLVLSPLTGRMHQLRVGAAKRGFPIVGDTLYGTQEPGLATSDPVVGPPHSRSISLRSTEIAFHCPENGKRTTVTAPPLLWPPQCG